MLTIKNKRILTKKKYKKKRNHKNKRHTYKKNNKLTQKGGNFNFTSDFDPLEKHLIKSKLIGRGSSPGSYIFGGIGGFIGQIVGSVLGIVFMAAEYITGDWISKIKLSLMDSFDSKTLNLFYNHHLLYNFLKYIPNYKFKQIITNINFIIGPLNNKFSTDTYPAYIITEILKNLYNNTEYLG